MVSNASRDYICNPLSSAYLLVIVDTYAPKSTRPMIAFQSITTWPWLAGAMSLARGSGLWYWEEVFASTADFDSMTWGSVFDLLGGGSGVAPPTGSLKPGEPEKDGAILCWGTLSSCGPSLGKCNTALSICQRESPGALDFFLCMYDHPWS